jgi:hypothetical protein
MAVREFQMQEPGFEAGAKIKARVAVPGSGTRGCSKGASCEVVMAESVPTTYKTSLPCPRVMLRAAVSLLLSQSIYCGLCTHDGGVTSCAPFVRLWGWSGRYDEPGSWIDVIHQATCSSRTHR